jgi:hypothetical protein
MLPGDKQLLTGAMFLVCRCKQSLILHGVIECYYVFDRTSYRTGLNQLKNTAPYPGISLNFCALQLDAGPVKTSTICFDNSGIDPNHPYVIAKVQPIVLAWDWFRTGTCQMDSSSCWAPCSVAPKMSILVTSCCTCCADRDGGAPVQHLPDPLRRQRARRQRHPAAGLHDLVHLLLCLGGSA